METEVEETKGLAFPSYTPGGGEDHPLPSSQVLVFKAASFQNSHFLEALEP